MSDESELVQFGDSVDTYYYSHKEPKNQPTAWSRFPTPEEPFSKYKYASINLTLDRDLVVDYRSTYDFLDWLGDVGGFYSALLIVAQAFSSHYTQFVF